MVSNNTSFRNSIRSTTCMESNPSLDLTQNNLFIKEIRVNAFIQRFMIPRLFIVLWLFSVRLTFLVSWNPSSLALLNRGKVSDSMIPMISNCEDQRPLPPPIVKRLLCIRHGISVANEWMSQSGNQWGDPNFRDEGKPDSPLSERGRQKTKEFLERQFRQSKLLETLEDVELILVSPLTRCLETFHDGVEPILMETMEKDIPIIALPLLRERVYTASDTGRIASVLSCEFPSVDFSECPRDDPWWYIRGEEFNSNDEWRPHGENQWYAVPGEPEDVFDERMKELDEWIGNRPEKTILIVTHWGVLRHLTNGIQFLNAEARILEHSFCPVKRTSVVAHL